MFFCVTYRILTALIFVVLASTVGCFSYSSNALRSEVSGKGRIALNAQNSYVAPNRFITEEAEKSKTLKGFLSVQGSPAELEFEDSLIFAPTLSLYYLDKGEYFSLKYVADDWIISGPYPIADKAPEEDKETGGLFSAGAPLLQEPPSNKPDQMPTNLQLPLPEELKKSDLPDKVNAAENKLPATFEDVYHVVKFNQETFAFIAQWYTGDIANQDRIKSINAVAPGAFLAVGSSIRIPSYLLKKREMPSEDDFKKYMLVNP